MFADDPDKMIKQALKIKEWGKNVYVKVPVTNSKGKFSGKAIRYLSHRNVKLNITAVYTAQQTKKIIKNLNKKHKVYHFNICWTNGRCRQGSCSNI